MFDHNHDYATVDGLREFSALLAWASTSNPLYVYSLPTDTQLRVSPDREAVLDETVVACEAAAVALGDAKVWQVTSEKDYWSVCRYAADLSCATERQLRWLKRREVAVRKIVLGY